MTLAALPTRTHRPEPQDPFRRALPRAASGFRRSVAGRPVARLRGTASEKEL